MKNTRYQNHDGIASPNFGILRRRLLGGGALRSSTETGVVAVAVMAQAPASAFALL